LTLVSKLLLRRIFPLTSMNGAGKTTLVRILATQLGPTQGRAPINGLDVMKDAKKARWRDLFPAYLK